MADSDLPEGSTVRLTSVIARLASASDRQHREHIVDDIQTQLETAEDKLVSEADEHHAKFYDALEAFQYVSATINDSKMKVEMLRAALTECRAYLQLKRERIYRLSNEHAEYTEMMSLLEQIDQIRKVPEKVDEFLKRQNYVEAAELLVETTDAIEGEALGQVIALHDFLRKLIDKANRMRQTILSEMEQHIYGKRETTADGSGTAVSEEKAFAVLSHGIQALQVLHRPEKKNGRGSGSPPAAISALRSNLKSELTIMIDRALADEQFRQRAEGLRERATAEDQSGPRLLHRFLSLLYEKLFHVLSCHAHILSVMRDTEEGQEALARANAEASYSDVTVWDAIQLEMQLVLCKYLDLEPKVILESYATNTARRIVSPSEAPSDASGSGSAPLFSFANSLNSMTESAAKAERALTALSPPYPGGDVAVAEHGEASEHGAYLVCEASPMNITGIYKSTVLFTQEMEAIVFESARGANRNDEAQHAQPPRISRLRLPLNSFIDAFIVRSYIPIIQAEVQSRLANTAETADKPLDDHGIVDAPRVLFRSTVEVNEMVGQLCGQMLDLPSRCTDFTEMMLLLINRYLKIAQQRFKALVRLPASPKSKKGRTAISAEVQSQEAMQEHLKRLPCWIRLEDGRGHERGASVTSIVSTGHHEAGAGGLGESERLEGAESELLLSLIRDVPAKDESIFNLHTIKCIAYLHESMNWFADTLEKVADCLASDDHRGLSQLWVDVGPVVDEDMLATPDTEIPRIISSRVTSDQILEIRSVAGKYHQISFACLATLRLELRVHCLHYLMPVFRKSSHVCTAEQIEEADAQVVTLCKDILCVDETLSHALHPMRYAFVMQGLGAFLAHYLVKDLIFVKKVNDMGVMRVCRSIFALQQTLRSINQGVCATVLDLAMAYYELLNLQPEQIIEGLMVAGNRKLFSEEEYAVVLNLVEASQAVQNAAAHKETLKHLEELFHAVV